MVWGSSLVEDQKLELQLIHLPGSVGLSKPSGKSGRPEVTSGRAVADPWVLGVAMPTDQHFPKMARAYNAFAASDVSIVRLVDAFA